MNIIIDIKRAPTPPPPKYNYVALVVEEINKRFKLSTGFSSDIVKAQGGDVIIMDNSNDSWTKFLAIFALLTGVSYGFYPNERRMYYHKGQPEKWNENFYNAVKNLPEDFSVLTVTIKN